MGHHEKDNKRAIDTINRVFVQEKTTTNVADFYNNWKDYDEDVCAPERYNGPLLAARYAHKYMKGDTSKHIIDVGAGSGRIAVELSKFAAYEQLDALEPATQFFERSPHKELYKKHICEYVGKGSSINDDCYDMVVTAGTFLEGHIPCGGLKEFIRMTKPGGYIVIAMRKEYLYTVPEYRDRLEPYIDELVTQGKCQLSEQAEEPNFMCEKPGRIFVMKVTEAGFREYCSDIVKDSC